MKLNLAWFFLPLLASCMEEPGTQLNVADFTPPDSLGKAILVSIHEDEPLGAVTYLSYKDSVTSGARLVTYFSDGTSIAEKLILLLNGDLQTLDGEKRFTLSRTSVTEFHLEKSGCWIGLNVTKQGDR